MPGLKHSTDFSPASTSFDRLQLAAVSVRLNCGPLTRAATLRARVRDGWVQCRSRTASTADSARSISDASWLAGPADSCGRPLITLAAPAASSGAPSSSSRLGSAGPGGTAGSVPGRLNCAPSTPAAAVASSRMVPQIRKVILACLILRGSGKKRLGSGEAVQGSLGVGRRCPRWGACPASVDQPAAGAPRGCIGAGKRPRWPQTERKALATSACWLASGAQANPRAPAAARAPCLDSPYDQSPCRAQDGEAWRVQARRQAGEAGGVSGANACQGCTLKDLQRAAGSPNCSRRLCSYVCRPPAAPSSPAASAPSRWNPSECMRGAVATCSHAAAAAAGRRPPPAACSPLPPRCHAAGSRCWPRRRSTC